MAVEAMAPPVLFQIDPTYEFDAPRFYDFEIGESESDMRAAELWFESDHTYAPSPFMPKIKKDRSVKLDVLCDFENDEKVEEESELKIEAPQDANTDEHSIEQVTVLQTCAPTSEDEKNSLSDAKLVKNNHNAAPDDQKGLCTPGINQTVQIDAKVGKEQKNGSSVGKPSALQVNDSTRLLKSDAKSVRPKNLPISSAQDGLKSAARSTKKVLASDIAQENQAIKRQKLEGGKSRQILDVKDRILLHKSKLVLATSNDEIKDKSQRKMYERDQVKVNPFVSAAEMVQKFHSSTRKIELSGANKSMSHDEMPAAMQGRPTLKLTQPKEPELQTSQRARFVKVKSSAEIEEELLAKMPKFKARPVNKKIFDAPKLPPVPPKKAPQLPQFQEFHLKTMERAAQNNEPVFAAVSVSTPSENHNSKVHKLTEPKTPRLETSCRARPIKLKTSEELELEELEKVPQFKARPLDKKILESKGALGLTRIHKRQLTVPREFNFATDERLLPLKSVENMFDKLSLNSETQREQQQQLPRITTPNPFHLQTEERGMIKEKRLADELLHKQLEEEKARIPKANPYPYTTDIPVIPPKPAPKSCTKPEAFQLESLVRHEEEVQKKNEERERMEKEEARNRIFKAAPIMKEDPIPLPQKERKPLTQVQDFVLHVEHRAVDRSEFDKKINEKEMMYKRYREEYELNQKIEDEKELKQIRRAMVPHARPIPSFANPFLPQKSTKEATKAKSPKLRILQRKGVANISQMR